MRWFAPVALAALLLTGCAGGVAPATPAPPEAATTTPEAVAPANEAGYPAPAYPEPEMIDGYPAPTAELPQGPGFSFNTPIRATDTQVSGSGPAGVPVRVVNITQGAAVIAETTIGDDGAFSVAVTGLSAGDWIGLMLGEVQGTRFSPNEFIRGPGYQDIPLIGIVFTSELVEE